MLGGHAEEQVRSLFSYGRELMSIAGGIKPYAVRTLSLLDPPDQANKSG